MTEAELPTVASRAVSLATIAVERLWRASETNLRFLMASNVQRRRLKKADWRGRAVERWKAIFNGCEAGWKFPPFSKSWRRRTGLRIVPGGMREDNDVANLKMAEQTLRNNEDFDLVVYTDG
jgi:hypothetical protein